MTVPKPLPEVERYQSLSPMDRLKHLLRRTHCWHVTRDAFLAYRVGDKDIWQRNLQCCRCGARGVQNWDYVVETVPGHGPHLEKKVYQWVWHTLPGGPCTSGHMLKRKP